MKLISKLRQRAKQLEAEIYTLYLAYKHRRTPWYAKAFMFAVICYALSPIDLIPDFIPVLGYLDDLIIIPAGIALALRMIPHDVIQECRIKTKTEPLRAKQRWIVAAIIIGIWLLIVSIIVLNI
ncbi:MAG: YkvA family protein [Chloroflexi bacterium]|nr:YkvA family protein [Chloroflexota bacterium]